MSSQRNGCSLAKGKQPINQENPGNTANKLKAVIAVFLIHKTTQSSQTDPGEHLQRTGL